MTRFKKAVEEWKRMTSNERDGSFSPQYMHDEIKSSITTAWVILLDVCKAVDAYERTLKDLKAQNSKLRRGRRKA